MKAKVSAYGIKLLGANSLACKEPNLVVEGMIFIPSLDGSEDIAYSFPKIIDIEFSFPKIIEVSVLMLNEIFNTVK